MWAWWDQHGGVFYEVTPTRNRDGPRRVIGDREGHLQCDGHDCYSGLDADQITRMGCWAHYPERAVIQSRLVTAA
ncbi:MAG: transposase [Dehalococcoidia bacterium]